MSDFFSDGNDFQSNYLSVQNDLQQGSDKQRIHPSLLQDTEAGIIDFRETIIQPGIREAEEKEASQEAAPVITPAPKIIPQNVKEEPVLEETKQEEIPVDKTAEEEQVTGEVQEVAETNTVSPPKVEAAVAEPVTKANEDGALEEITGNNSARENTEEVPAQEGAEEKAEKKEGEESAVRITDVIDPSKEGGDERVKTANEKLKQAEQDHLENTSRKKAQQGAKGINKLSANEKEKEPAGEKLQKTEDAVVEQKTEKEAEVNAKQVDAVAEVTPPEAKEEDAQKTLQESMDAALPKTIEDVDEFKKRGKASKIGDQVKKTIEGKTKEISGTFEQLDKTEKPADPKQAVPFSEIEKALPTNNLNIGNDLIPPVQDATLDLQSYVEESDNLLQKEGIKQEHLDMVDSGDLFEAKTLKEDVETKSSEQPDAIRKEEKGLHKETETHLAQEEKSEKEEMEKQRSAGLGNARKDQGDTKTSFEKKKEEVTNHINGIYETTNKNVQDKLDNLKKDSMAAFDREEAAASSAFEANVKYRMDKFKEKRYDGIFGTAKQVKDFFLGIDDMPEVKEIFESEKTTFINRIDAAIAKIINDSQKVIDECKALIAQARKDIEKYVSTLSPDLKKIGEDAQKDIQKKLDELDEKVNKAAEDLKKELEKKRAEAIKKIDEKIEKMKEEMSGMLSKIGNLLLDAAIKFFKWALEAAGYSTDELMGVINKGKAVITAIVKDPIQFMANLAKAVGSGLKNFGANIMTHLKEGFTTWITGQMGALPIQVPDKLDVKGVFSIALQVLGLTWSSLRGKLSKKVGEEKVQMAEKSVDIVTEVKDKGPIAMYDQLKDQAENVKTEVMEGAKEWAITSIIKNGLIKVASMLNPAGAIVQAILAIYNGVMFFVNNWQRIVDFVNSIFDSIASIASGAIGAAAGFIEKTLAKTIPLILDFLARFIGLSGIADKIQKVIQKVRKPIDKAIDKVINFIEAKVKKLWGKVSGKDKKDKNGNSKKDGGKDKEKKDDKRTMEQKIADVASAKKDAQALLDKPDATLESVRAGLPDIKQKYKLTKIEVESLGDYEYDVFVEINPTGKTDKKVLASAAEMLLKAKPHFAGKTFKMEELKDYLMKEFEIKLTTCKSRIKEWKESGELHECTSAKAGANDSNKVASFDKSLLPGEVRPVNASNRSTYGYNNPDQSSPTGLKIIRKGLIIEKDPSSPTGYKYNYEPGKEFDLTYLQTEAQYRCAVSQKIIGWGRIHMGHHDVGCSVHWNSGGGHGSYTKPGHTQTKEQNKAWNCDPDNYRGPEDKDVSSGSGGGTEGYLTPGPPNHPDSHPMWWDPTHPNYGK